jgi:O-antigen biosynthesis protein
MGKYDALLDLDFKNAASIIAGRIKKNSRVLEFGPAGGRLTRYLHEQKGCDITIVEIDETSGSEAARFATRSFLGRDHGDIESYVWHDRLEGERFDHIIFADVLEHLHDPEAVLSKSSRLLGETGSILISVPNIAHNSIIIDLMNNRFRYGEIGLLDNTHLRFFTYYSFTELLNRIGLFTVGEFCATARVGETEFENSYRDISPPAAKELRKKEFGNVYQFVFEVKSKHRDATFETDIWRNLDKTASYQAVLYIDDGTGFCETKKISRYIFPEQNRLEFDLKPFGPIRGLRFDPIDTNCIIRIDRLETVDENGTRIRRKVSAHNADYAADNIFCYESTDPHIQVDINEPVQAFSIAYAFVDYEFSGDGRLAFLFDQLRKTREQLTEVYSSRTWRYTRIFRKKTGR